MLDSTFKYTPALSRRVGRKYATGGSLIEILVSLLLVAFGFLGIGALFNYSIAANKSASSRLLATMLIQDYADMARANPNGFTANGYNNALTSYDPDEKAVAAVTSSNLCTYPNCTAATGATQDKELFKQRVRALLPAGSYVATRSTVNTNVMDIWIIWVEGNNVTDPNTGNDVCPAIVTSTNPPPRCLYARISL